MARVSLIEEKDHPELAELIAMIRGGRGGRLLNIYKMHTRVLQALEIDAERQ
jgi:hypothetical protein